MNQHAKLSLNNENVIQKADIKKHLNQMYSHDFQLIGIFYSQNGIKHTKKHILCCMCTSDSATKLIFPARRSKNETLSWLYVINILVVNI